MVSWLPIGDGFFFAGKNGRVKKYPQQKCWLQLVENDDDDGKNTITHVSPFFEPFVHCFGCVWGVFLLCTLVNHHFLIKFGRICFMLLFPSILSKCKLFSNLKISKRNKHPVLQSSLSIRYPLEVLSDRLLHFLLGNRSYKTSQLDALSWFPFVKSNLKLLWNSWSAHFSRICDQIYVFIYIYMYVVSWFNENHLSEENVCYMPSYRWGNNDSCNVLEKKTYIIG